MADSEGQPEEFVPMVRQIPPEVEIVIGASPELKTTGENMETAKTKEESAFVDGRLEEPELNKLLLLGEGPVGSSIPVKNAEAVPAVQVDAEQG